MNFSQLASKIVVNRVIESLIESGIDAVFLENGQEAKDKVLELIPKDAEVMNMTSVTLETIGLAKELQENHKYNNVRKKLQSMDRKTQSAQMQKIGCAPEWVVGSVHAVTEDGKIMIASNTGSQIGPYAFGSTNVIFVVGSQKIVKDEEIGLKRIYEYCLPLESERAKKAYGMETGVNKILFINKEVVAGRIKILIVNEVLGY